VDVGSLMHGCGERRSVSPVEGRLAEAKVARPNLGTIRVSRRAKKVAGRLPLSGPPLLS
jgi:hypothetical protein